MDCWATPGLRPLGIRDRIEAIGRNSESITEEAVADYLAALPLAFRSGRLDALRRGFGTLSGAALHAAGYYFVIRCHCYGN